MLDLPLEQYIELICRTAERLYGATASTEALPEEMASVLESIGINPQCWQAAVGGYERDFRCVAGSAPSLQKFLDRAGRKTVQGIRACRTAFT